MKTGPLCPVFGRRANGSIFIKRMEVWVHTKKGWRTKRADKIPKKSMAVFKQRIRQRKVWPWPHDEFQLQAVKKAKLRAATGYDNWTMGAVPAVEMADNDETDYDESDEICNEEDEV